MHSIKAQNISGPIIETSKVHASLNTRMTLRYIQIPYVGTMKALLPWYSTNYMSWLWLRYWNRHIKWHYLYLVSKYISFFQIILTYSNVWFCCPSFALQGIDNNHKTFWWQLFYDETNANTKTMAFSKSAVFSNVMTKTKIQLTSKKKLL